MSTDSLTVTGQCDRACLDDFVDQYLDAVVARDPLRLPLAKTVKFTENGQKLKLGDGLWNTASARGTYKLYVAGPQAGHGGFFGTIRESGTPTILALRLKVENRQIEAVLGEAPYRMNSGWSSWEEGMSSRARW